MKKNIFYLSEEKIKSDIAYANQLANEKKIDVYPLFSKEWTVGVSNLNYKTHLLLAIFLGFFGVDRFYLKKNVSAVIKIFFICVISPIFIWVIAATNLFLIYPDIVVIFSLFFFSIALGFYFGDIYLAILKPRDAKHLRLVK
ncbi:TM2 domain-containing protein [[Mycoplasma] cavipharyngis]|uniref:TM2 domain-containing protein n=1 Tax=[Mycoplasma] cavipharyngis TaxID=92757 RepID=UPI0037043681